MVDGKLLFSVLLFFIGIFGSNRFRLLGLLDLPVGSESLPVLRLDFVKHFLQCLGTAFWFLLQPRGLPLRFFLEIVLVPDIIGVVCRISL